MEFATILCAVLLSVNMAVPLDTGMLQLDEVTITASHRHANPISSQSSVEVDAAYLNEQIPVSLAKGLDAIAVPDDVLEGDYHFMLRLTDRAGWQTIKAVPIHLIKQTL